CLTFDLFEIADLEEARHAHHSPNEQIADGIIHRHAYKMFFEGANNSPSIIKNNISKEYYNYLIGNDHSKWASKVFAYSEVIYKNLYSGINLKMYSSGENLKYDLIVSPGTDESQIQFRYDGTDEIKIVNGDLIISTSVGAITELKPYAYQKRKGQLVAVPCNYVLTENTISFNFPEGYNKNLELIIDPTLVFGSYTGSPVDNWGYTATYDASGNLFGGGIAFGSGYPTTVGAYTTSYQGGATDISISLFTADGSSLIYSTYLGGNSSELPHSLMATETGELVIYGTTGSSDFPMLADSYDDTFNGGTSVTVDVLIAFGSGIDIYLAKLSADGTTLMGSTFIGGTSNDGMNLKGGLTTQYNYGDFARGEVILDASNNVYVASSTTSTNFPTTPGVFQSTLSGDQEGVVFKFNDDLSNLIWSSYIGGSDEDGAYSMKLNSLDEPIVCGGTASSDFPATPGSWHSSYLGGITDGWVARISDDATSIIACTYVGTNNYDQTFFVETDISDNIYFTGQTRGPYPVTAGVYTEAGGKQFITKVEPDLSAVIFSAVFGTGGAAVNISPSAFLVDECENVYVSGWGGIVNTGFNFATGYTTGMTITPDAIQATTDGSDFYFYVLSKNGIDLLFASYFGGPSSPEHVDGGTSRFDKNGAIYQAVCAGCWGLDDFPTTPGAWSEVNGGSLCNLGVAKIDFNLSGIYADADADPALTGCTPFDVDFVNTSIGAVNYIWDFGDGSPQTTVFEPSHTFTTPGVYSVMLVAIDSNSCNIADTTYLSIIVLNDSISAEFSYSGNEDCDSLLATFTTIGTLLATTSLTWDFGDGTTSTLPSPTHTYFDPGEYIVTLIVNDPL
ncbi:MAG: PKD domain-containing protein, partial [Chitinophagales bacterium]